MDLRPTQYNLVLTHDSIGMIMSSGIHTQAFKLWRIQPRDMPVTLASLVPMGRMLILKH